MYSLSLKAFALDMVSAAIYKIRFRETRSQIHKTVL